jgi:hypothetical protein
VIVEDGCVSWHMSLPDGRYGFSPEVGGHSFSLAGEVHEADKLNTSGCISCHTDIKQAAGTSDRSRAGGAGVIWVSRPGVFAITAKDTRPLEQVAALYNYKLVLEDRSRGVHNATYTLEVLYDTIAVLDPTFDTSRRP